MKNSIENYWVERLQYGTYCVGYLDKDPKITHDADIYDDLQEYKVYGMLESEEKEAELLERLENLFDQS